MTESMLDLLPIADFTAAAHPSGTGVLIIRHLPGIAPPEATPEQIERATSALQYAIRPEQCEALARILSELATKLRSAKKSLN